VGDGNGVYDAQSGAGNGLLRSALRALIVIVLLGLAGSLLAPYEAAAAKRIGFVQGADALDAFTVRYLDTIDASLAPAWAFTDLAELRPAPDRIIQIAQLAKRHRTPVAIQLYELAIARSSPDPHIEWLEEYAGLLAPVDAAEAANAHLAAANLALRASEYDAMYRNFEASLALRDDADVRWKEAQLLLERDDSRAAGVLRRMIERHQNETLAQYTLGLLLWRTSADPKETEGAFRAAAADPRYRAGLEGFYAARNAATELDALQKDEETRRAAAADDRNNALAQHEALYQRLKRFQCDVRQWSDWEQHSDEELARGCSRIRLTVALTRLLMLAVPLLIPELLVARAGVAAEIGAVEGRALAAEAATAARAGATAEEAYATAATRCRRAGGSSSVETSVEARKTYAWKMSFGAEFSARLEAEQFAVVKEIELVLEFRREEITTYFRPLEDRAQSVRATHEANRDAELARIRKTDHVVRVKLGRIPLDDAHRSDCRTNSAATSPAACPSPSPTNVN
jgi:hypothetical protein